MIHCAVDGDSIGVGIAQHLPQCVAVARVGITSVHWLARYRTFAKRPQDVCVVSLGANDLSFNDYSVLLELRRTLVAKTVIWIVPANHPKSAHNVRNVAYEFGDSVIDVADFKRAPDHIHPTKQSYEVIAEIVKAKLNQ